jgi:sarcosine oxidase subunit gamma
MPSVPRIARGATCDFAWAGPDSWLAIASCEGFVDDLTEKFADCASVADLSHARVVLRVSGRNVRETLAKGIPIDLHPRVFSPGSVAVTAVSHIGVTVWQVDEKPTYDLLVFRSLAKSFWAWLSASAAEFGLDIRQKRNPSINSI